MQSRCHVVICKSKGSCRLLPVVFSLGSPKVPEDEECLVQSLSWFLKFLQAGLMQASEVEEGGEKGQITSHPPSLCSFFACLSVFKLLIQAALGVKPNWREEGKEWSLTLIWINQTNYIYSLCLSPRMKSVSTLQLLTELFWRTNVREL